MRGRQQLSSVILSLFLHGITLVAMAMFTMAAAVPENSFVIETIVADEDRVQDEFVQELDTQDEIAETFSFQFAAVSTDIGGSENDLPARQKSIDLERVVKEPELSLNVNAIDVPGLEILGDDLGQAEITGETGALVADYATALSRVTYELIRLLRQHRLLWMAAQGAAPQ